MNHIFWFTGLSGAGKTTITERFKRIIKQSVVIMDADKFREYITPDLGYDEDSRRCNVLEAIKIAVFLNKLMNLPIVCCFTSPAKNIRNIVRDYAEINGCHFHEIFIQCSLKKCIKRDPKGLYAKKLPNMVGIDINYDDPQKPDLTLNTDKYSISWCVHEFVQYYIKVIKTNDYGT